MSQKSSNANLSSLDDDSIKIKSLAQLKADTTSLFAKASKSIQIYSSGLDPRILNSREIEQHLIKFIKKSRASKLQMLIYDEKYLQGIDHRLVALAQRFTSFAEIRIVPADYQDKRYGFYIVDDKIMLHRKNTERYEAEILIMPSFTIKEKIKLFDTIWQCSDPASFLRALNL